MSADEGKEEYEEVQADLRRKDEEVSGLLWLNRTFSEDNCCLC